MKRITLTAMLLLGMVYNSVAREGYHINLSMPGVKDSMVYLVHYYGKALPNIYKKDSARFDKKGNAVFDSKEEEFIGGIYMMLLADRKTYFEFLLNNGDDISISADISKLPQGLKFTNSPENDHFQDYTSFLKGYATKQQDLQKEYAAAKTAADTAAVQKKSSTVSKELINYRRENAKKYPNSLLASIFNSLEVPQVPPGDHYLEDGKTRDSNFAYQFYKNHYWDNFNLQDDRLVHTPVFDAKLDEYMNKLVLPWPDSVEKEANMLLARTKGTKELFKYTLWWLTKNVEDSKVMGMDEAFVYLVENYYMKGDATWLTNEELNKYIDRAMKIAPNVIGNLAPNIKLPQVISKKEATLHDVKAKYTLLVFYSPTCGHCQHEIPSMDSLYREVLKKKGVRIFSVATESDEKTIADFITRHKLDEWINTWDHEHVGDWRGKYDVYSTPTVYLLDEKKIIRGKRLDHTNIAGLVEMLDRQEKEKKKNKQ